jgi:hypothetical protein
MDPASARSPDVRWPRLRALILVALVLAWTGLVSAPPARADCPLLDLECVVDEVEDAVDAVDDAADDVVDVVDDTVDEVLDAVDDTVDDVVDVVDDVLDVVDDVVDEVVDTVEDTVDSIDGSDDDPTVPPGEDGGGGRNGDPGELRTEAAGAPPAGASSAPQARAGEATPAGRPEGDPDGGAPDETVAAPTDPSEDGGGVLAAASSPIEAPAARAAVLGVLAETDRGPFGFDNAVGGLAFPLALAVAVGIFLLLQGRIDRRSPKLALAPVEPDVVGFPE